MWKRMYANTTVNTARDRMGALSLHPAVLYYMVLYMRYPYVSSTLDDYRESHEYLIFLPSTTNGGFDQRFEVKGMVLGLCRDDQMVIVFDASSRTALAYFSEVEGRLLSFYGIESEGPLPLEFMDIETRSRWNMLGEAVGSAGRASTPASAGLQLDVVRLVGLLAGDSGLGSGRWNRPRGGYSANNGDRGGP